MKQIYILLVIINLQLVAQDNMRKCTQEDLIGGVWLSSHTKLFNKTADKSPGSYLSFFLKDFQLLKYLDNNEFRSVYSDRPSDKTISTSVKLLNHPQNEIFKIKDGIIKTYYKNNKKQIDEISCRYFTNEILESKISKGSIYLIRYADGKPLVGNIFKKVD